MITTSTSGQEFIQQHSTPMPQPLNTDWKQRLNKKLQNIFINKIVDASYIIEQHIEKELASQKQELIKRFEETVVNSLESNLREAIDIIEAIRDDEYTPDSFTTQPWRVVLEELDSKLAELKEST